jgi:hypothetical protein
MAHFAQLDENNIVTQVIVVANNELLLDGIENEIKGIMFCRSLLGEHTNWIQTSYNASIRKNYAGVGYTYDSVRDAFIASEPEGNIGFDETTCQWIMPVPEIDDIS